MICMALSETTKCRNLILGRGIGWGCWHVISLYDLDFLDVTLNLAKCRKFYLVSLLVLGCRCAMSQCDLGVTFYLGSARMFSAAIFETYLSYHKDVWITVGDYYVHVVLSYCVIFFKFKDIHHLLNRSIK